VQALGGMKYLNLLIIIGVLGLAIMTKNVAWATNSANSILTWDIGSEEGQIDYRDIIVDKTRPCSASSNLGVINFPQIGITAKTLKSYKFNKIGLTNKFLKKYGISRLPKDVLNLVYSVDTFEASSQQSELIFLLPEIHNNNSLEYLERLRSNSIEYSRALFALSVTAGVLGKSDSLVLNLKEAPKDEGIHGDEDLPIDLKSILQESEGLETKGAVKAVQQLAIIFQRLKRVYTLGAENPIRIAMNLLTITDPKRQEQNFEKLFKNVALSFASAEREHVLNAFEALSKMSDDEYARFSENVCEMRSEDIASESLELIHNYSPKIVFLTYGLSHHYGITTFLRMNRKSFVTLMGRSDLAHF